MSFFCYTLVVCIIIKYSHIKNQATDYILFESFQAFRFYQDIFYAAPKYAPMNPEKKKNMKELCPSSFLDLQAL